MFDFSGNGKMRTMSKAGQASERRRAVGAMKRRLILEAARRIFEREGLDGASLRAIAAEAGYTPAALYFHFDSKEAIYGAVLEESLNQLRQAVGEALVGLEEADRRLAAAAMAFFRFYRDNPRDLDLGFYLFRGGMKPQGLGAARDEALNAALKASLAPIAEAALALGAAKDAADLLMVDVFAHAAGLLLLSHTGRIRLFDAEPAERMERFVMQQLALLKRAPAASPPSRDRR